MEALLASGIFVVISVIIGLLIFIAPLGIWHRLISMHRDQKRDAAAARIALDAIRAELAKQTAYTKKCAQYLYNIASSGSETAE